MAFNEEKELDSEVKEEVLEEVEEKSENEEIAIEVASEKESKTVKSTSKNKKPSKIKAAFSELKKVTWPTFPSVVKKTAVVLTVTLIFLIVIMGIDQLLYLLFGLLTKKA